MLKRWLLAGLCLFIFGSMSTPSHAQNKWQTNRYLEMAREALALGETTKWEQALKLADKNFELEKPKMSFSEQNNFKLWIVLFWSKYHQFKGTPPEIKNIKDFENIKTFQNHIERLENCITHLKKSNNYLKQYNLMYMQVARRSNLQQQIYLQASLSLERDLEGQIRSNKIYLSFLNFALNQKKTQAKTDKKIELSAEEIKKLNKRSQDSKETLTKLRENQQKLAQKAKVAQANYEIVQQGIRRKASTAAILTWGGVAVAVLAAGGIGVGVYFIVEAQNTALTPLVRQQNNDIGLYTIIASGAVLVLAGAAIISGIAINPGAQERSRAVIDSQNKHLDPEKTSSRRQPHPSKHLANIPPPHPNHTQVFGTW